ncbi:carbamoyltransferase HypF [Candidatus Methylacidiphilum fumarolicum]|nr:carbamoyltransferase HypF [Candidatus Methylacidiphilum fumarolicum]
MKKALRIHLKGKVQGVGFRPFVYKLAHRLALQGWVNNTTSGVHIHVEGTQENVETFCRDIIDQAPSIAFISSSVFEKAEVKHYKSFTIEQSQEEGKPSVLLLPDLDLCEDCLVELRSPTNRRFGYPFITCTQCGPRFSIILSLPYDRQRTTMASFKMCYECQREYEEPLDRRFYSQTNSCKDCGITLRLYDKQRNELSCNHSALDEAAKGILAGEIVAVKGIGGFLIVADSYSDQTVLRLRESKKRAHKPFALMFQDLKTVKEHTEISGEEEMWLTSRQKPIMLLRKKTNFSSALSEHIAPLQDTLGIMLAYAPLYVLLLDLIQHPVIATSANISGSPILTTEEEVFSQLQGVVDKVLTHNRDIAVPQDDSVMACSPLTKTPILLRRSRSFAPFYRLDSYEFSQSACLLALGSDLKATFSLCHESNVYVSQYLGDLGNWNAYETYQKVLTHFTKLFDLIPTAVAVDLHPRYHSTELGLEISKSNKLNPFFVQHHKAHFWAVLAENDLLWQQQPVLGIVWDGTGYGEDGRIWGGEFFLFQRDQGMKRLAHFEYFPLLLADKGIKEPRISALGIWSSQVGTLDELNFLRPKFSAIEWRAYLKMLEAKKYALSSSVGRIFDGVASILGLCDYTTFEGQAAIELQKQATRYALSVGLWNNTHAIKNWKVPEAKLYNSVVYLGQLFQWIRQMAEEKRPKEEIAFGLHYWLAQLVGRLANEFQVRKIAFSGGVFQNGLLVDLLKLLWGDKLELFFHRTLCPNDENISFGQLIALAYENHWIRKKL